MYDPVKDGVAKSATSISYTEVAPPERLSELVHCYWELRTETDLTSDFSLHALPDACVNVLFNLIDPAIAGVTALHTGHIELNLGTSFWYVGIQLFPGVWTGAPAGTVDHFVGEPYDGPLPLASVGRALAALRFADQVPVLTDFVDALHADGVIASNPVTAAILERIGEIHSVADMASAVGLSTRQLQRRLKASTGFTPHDLLKVLRLQNAFRQDYLHSFADQSHYTHSFRQIMGMTPGQFRRRFDV